MIHMTKNLDKQSREIQDAIGKLLYEDWGPIGVRGSAPKDEYDSYVGGIYRLLCSNPNEAQVVEHLLRIETQVMALGESSPRRLAQLAPIAKKLLSMDIKLHRP
jgi:hypothetical protein